MLLVQIADRTHPAVTVERWQGPEGLLEAPLQAGLLGLRVALQWVGERGLVAARICCEQPRLLGFLEGELVVPDALRLEVGSIRCLLRWSKARVFAVAQVQPSQVAWLFSVRRANCPAVIARLGINLAEPKAFGQNRGLEYPPGAASGQAQKKQKGARDGAV